MTARHLEKSDLKPVVRGGIALYQADAALEVVTAAQRDGIEVLGIDGFFMTDTSTQPSMDHSADFSDGSADAVAFLHSQLGSGMYFEVVLADHA
jgi:hypothetical protein